MDKYFENLKILGLDKNANLEDIKKSYLELVQIMHPDKFSKDNLKTRANKELQKINEAYEYITQNYNSYKNIDILDNEQDGIIIDDFSNDFEDTIIYYDEDKPEEYNDYSYEYKNVGKLRKVSVKMKILIYTISFILYNIIFFVVSLAKQ